MREAVHGRPGALAGFAVFATAVWLIWGYKTVLSRSYRPYTTPHDASTTVVIPVVDEPVGLFREVLLRIVKQEPDQLIVVINGPANAGLEDVCVGLGVDWRWTPTPGKRNAIRVGVEAAWGDIVVLVDSDTLWTDNTLGELLKPFADPTVGGATTRQRILESRRHFFTRWADWMENSRALYSMPAQSVAGAVACLPGRTIAFRRSVLEHAMPEFLTARFLGIHLEVSDDRHLTNLTLKQGHRAVYQSTSLVYTDAPTQPRKLYKQQLRWARGSQYNHLRMLPWVTRHAPVLLPFFAVDLLLPYLLFGAAASWVHHLTTHTGANLMKPIMDAHPGPVGWAIVSAAIIVGSTLSMWLRQWRHLAEQPRDLPWMPLYILFSSLFLMPIRIIGFLRMAHCAGWGTRTDAYQGKRHRNPQAVIPWAAGLLLIGGEVAFVSRF